jgi:glycosyltransferase involved in cell wall biosynthesis
VEGPSTAAPRIALGPTEVAGCVTGYADGYRSRGAHVDVALWAPSPYAYGEGNILGRLERVRFALAAPFRFDVLHYQYGSTWAKTLDAYWARLGRRTLVCTYHGDDCRLASVARERFPARGRVVDPDREAAARRRLRRLGRVLDVALVADRELATYVAPYVRRVYVTPLPLHADTFAGGRVTLPSEPVVLHAASDPDVKGTAEIAAVVKRVAERVSLEFRVLTAAPQEEVARELRRATVVIDQLNSANSGVFALEAMRVGVPVLAEYEPAALPPYQSELPVVHVTAKTLGRELEALLTDDERRRRVADAGPPYVAARHDPGRVATNLLAVFEHARRSPNGVFHAFDGRIEPLDPPIR